MRTDRPGRPGRQPDPRGRAPERGRQQEPPQPRGDLLYGRNAVLESLRAGRRRHQRLLLAEGVKEDARIREAIALAEERHAALDRVQRLELDDRTRGANHQGIALATSPYPYASLTVVADAIGTVLMLDHLQDPQNLGTLLRAADAAGVAGVVIPRDRAAEITPAVVNASAGAVEHLPVAQEPNLVRAAEALKQTGRWVLALDVGPDAVDLYQGDLPLPAVLVIGGEGAGLSPLLRKTCDLVIAIPMTGRVQSLNAATAGSIALFELVRRARAHPS